MNGPTFVVVLTRRLLIVSRTGSTEWEVQLVVESSGDDWKEESTGRIHGALHQTKVVLDWQKVVADDFRMADGVHFGFVDEGIL